MIITRELIFYALSVSCSNPQYTHTHTHSHTHVCSVIPLSISLADSLRISSRDASFIEVDHEKVFITQNLLFSFSFSFFDSFVTSFFLLCTHIHAHTHTFVYCAILWAGHNLLLLISTAQSTQAARHPDVVIGSDFGTAHRDGGSSRAHQWCRRACDPLILKVFYALAALLLTLANLHESNRELEREADGGVVEIGRVTVEYWQCKQRWEWHVKRNSWVGECFEPIQHIEWNINLV